MLQMKQWILLQQVTSMNFTLMNQMFANKDFACFAPDILLSTFDLIVWALYLLGAS